MTGRSGPPRLAERVVGMLSPESIREFALGDMAERYECVRSRKGPIAAMCWYLWTTTRMAWWRVAQVGQRAPERRLSPPTPSAVSWRAVIESIADDLRYGRRRVLSSPGSAMSSLLVLSLAIGGSTALLSAQRSLGAWAPGLSDTESLHALAVYSDDRTVHRHPMAAATRLVEEIPDGSIAAVAHGFSIARSERGTQTVWAAVATPGLFDTLGVGMERGRPFRSGEAELVISYRFWQGRFDGEQAAVGSTLWVDGEPFTVVGVVDRDFRGLAGRPSLWRPVEDPLAAQSNSRSLVVLARATSSLEMARAASGAAAVLRPVTEEDWDREPSWVPARNVWYPQGETSAANRANVVTAVLALFVIVVACANVVNMHLANGLARRQEMNLRAAIGATRRRLLRLLIAENLWLALATCGGSLLVARLVLSAASRWFPTPLPGFETSFEMSFTVLAIAAGSALAITVGSALVPAARLSRRDPAGRDGARTTGVLVKWFTGAQLASAAGLMLVAFFLATGLYGVHNRPLGYEETDRFSFYVDGRAAGERRHEVQREFLETLAGTPGIEAVGVASPVPGFLGPRTPVRAGRDDTAVVAGMLAANAGYLDAAGTALVAGRGLRADDRDRPVALVSRSLQSLLWPDSTALGRTVYVGSEDESPESDRDHRRRYVWQPRDPSGVASPSAAGVPFDVRDRPLAPRARGSGWSAPWNSTIAPPGSISALAGPDRRMV